MAAEEGLQGQTTVSANIGKNYALPLFPRLAPSAEQIEQAARVS